jgi:hypothetical protein
MSAHGGHTVLRAHTVVRNFPLRIEAADAWGDSLVVGTADGALLVFAEAEPPAATPRGTPPPPPSAAPEEPRYEARARCIAPTRAALRRARSASVQP